ncbi:MAG: pseudaminic acid cytidylyltransferase [Polaribacter sp.]
MKSIAIIPARGGSKRIPRKNIKSFLGKPIIAYSIEIALQSNLFDEVMVSTDDDEIAEVAKKYGANIPFLRSKKNADDFATTFDVINEVLVKYQSLGINFEYACCIYPTAPFVSDALLKKAYNLLKNHDYDCVFPAMSFSFPIQRAMRITDSKSKIEMISPENLNKRSQDLEACYHDVGQFYFFNVNKILVKKKLWTDNTGSIIISELEGQDIDSLTDWKLAELKYTLLNEKKNSF